MFDGMIENPTALASLAVTLFVAVGACALHFKRMWRRGIGPGDPLAIYGLVLFAAVWLFLVPLNVLNLKLGGAIVAVFGAEGRDTGLVEFVTVAQWGACASLGAVLAWRRAGWERWLFAAGAAFAFWCMGEEVSWGQWLLHWTSPAYFQANNLQGETNLHNFAGPAFYDWLYRLAGLTLIAGAVALRWAPKGPALIGDVGRWLERSAMGLPLLTGAGVLMQHPAFQELSEAALTGGGVHGLAWVLGRTRRVAPICPVNPLTAAAP